MRLRTTWTMLAGGMMLIAGCFGGDGLEGACDRLRDLEPPPDPGAEIAELVARVNQVRADKGLPGLEFHPNLEERARSWAATMAREGRLYHSDVADDVTVTWQKLGENVGQGTRASAVHEGFLGSPAHYANLVDPEFTHVGVGVAADAAGIRYVTEVFVRLASDGGVPPSAEPVPRTTTSTVRTTSTTLPPAPKATSPSTAATAPGPTASPSTSPGEASGTTAPGQPSAEGTIARPEPLVVPGRPSPCAR